MKFKFLFVVIVATLFFTVKNVNAQNYMKITDVKYSDSDDKIEVTVCMTSEGKEKCSKVSFKVVCADGLLAELLNDRAKYGEVTNVLTDSFCTTVTFGCGEDEKDENKAKQCRLYDFKVETTDYELKD